MNSPHNAPLNGKNCREGSNFYHNVEGAMSKAIFFSRTGALLAASNAAKVYGVCDEVIHKHTFVGPVYSRGELKGWEAWFPYDDHGHRRPILED